MKKGSCDPTSFSDRVCRNSHLHFVYSIFYLFASSLVISSQLTPFSTMSTIIW